MGISHMTKQSLTRQQEYDANELFKLHGTVDIVDDVKYFTYDTDWNDTAVALAIGVPETYKTNIGTLRRELWGKERKPVKEKAPRIYRKMRERINSLEQQLLAVQTDLARQAEMIGKDCERLNITVLALSDICRGLGVNPPDYSVAYKEDGSHPKSTEWELKRDGPPKPVLRSWEPPTGARRKL
jgi:hypothetical protein